MSSYIEDRIEAKRQQRRFIDKEIEELERRKAGERRYYVTVEVTEVYIVDACSEEEALELFEEGVAGPPERHISDTPTVEEY